MQEGQVVAHKALGDSMTDIYFIERRSELGYSVTGSWTTINITTVAGVPPGAIAHIAIRNTTNNAAYLGGVRTYGSGLNRYVKLEEAETGYGVYATMYVTVDASTGNIEFYSGGSGLQFLLMGYWVGLNYTEAFADISPGSGSSWVNYDIYTNQSVPKGRVCDILLANYNEAGATSLGVRTDGSALDRRFSINESESASAEYTDCQTLEMLVKCDASTGYIEQYSSDTTYGKMYLLGYFGVELDYIELYTYLDFTATGSTWQTFSLSSYVDINDRTCDICMLCQTTGTNQTFGARQKGSLENRYLLIHESESNGANGAQIPANLDGYGRIELYSTINTADYFTLMGYYKLAINDTLLLPQVKRSAEALTTLPLN
jgi:hypothetical protein